MTNFLLRSLGSWSRHVHTSPNHNKWSVNKVHWFSQKEVLFPATSYHWEKKPAIIRFFDWPAALRILSYPVKHWLFDRQNESPPDQNSVLWSMVLLLVTICCLWGKYVSSLSFASVDLEVYVPRSSVCCLSWVARCSSIDKPQPAYTFSSCTKFREELIYTYIYICQACRSEPIARFI